MLIEEVENERCDDNIADVEDANQKHNGIPTDLIKLHGLFHNGYESPHYHQHCN